MMLLQKIVTPAKAGVQCFCNHPIFLDTGFRRYDIVAVSNFYEVAKNDTRKMTTVRACTDR